MGTFHQVGALISKHTRPGYMPGLFIWSGYEAFTNIDPLIRHLHKVLGDLHMQKVKDTTEFVIVSPMGNILRNYDDINKAKAFMDNWHVDGLRVMKKTTTFEEVEVEINECA